ncbi:hypothetical protein Taro_002152 [Colocasia esculenta]|uniref:Uncharacterized protein n=1 Tax=Colocasia esculenta TaxID=4460 RepID=A0A843TKW4_COLES|nr:hypothetical protein [Colocasia esculenta]
MRMLVGHTLILDNVGGQCRNRGRGVAGAEEATGGRLTMSSGPQTRRVHPPPEGEDVLTPPVKATWV